jgi:hypothetical protein
MLFELFEVTMTVNLKTFCRDLGLKHQFFPMWLVKMVWLRGKIIPFARWLERCLMNIGLRGDIGRKW